MLELVKKFLRDLNKYKMLDETDKIILGLSGGADSVTLLNLFMNCCKKKIKIIVAHVNHKLRGVESDRDECFVRNLCEKKNILFEIKRVDVKNIAHDKKICVEEAGRIIRYNFFYELAKKYSAQKIAVAHNRNDNIETILFNLIRGSGLNGLSGIAPVHDKIIRPLINISRNEIENYCLEKNIRYVTDSSNFNLDYTRNKIRNVIIPEILKINSNFINNVAINSEIIREDDKYIDTEAKKYIDPKKNFIDINKIACLTQSLKYRIIKLVIKINISHEINFVHVKMILDLINKKNNSKVYLPENIIARKSFDKIIFEKSKNIKNNFAYKINLEEKIFIKEIKKNILVSTNDVLSDNIYGDNKKKLLYKKIFYCDDISELEIRNYISGDKIFFDNFGHKKIKKIFSEKKINDWSSVALLVNKRNNVIWIISDAIDIISNNKHGRMYFIHVFI